MLNYSSTYSIGSMHLCLCFSYSITCGQLGQLRRAGMSWSAIADTLNVNRTTIYRLRKKIGINTNEAYRFSNIADADLDDILTSILHNSPNAGETFVGESLRARRIRIQRWRLRERLQVFFI